MSGGLATAEVDLLAPDNVADPYPALARLRAEDPVHWSWHHRAWIVSRYDDVFEAFRDRRLSSDRVTAIYETKLSDAERAERGPTYAILGTWMVFKDPPDHTRLRGLVKQAFTPRAVERLRPRVAELVDHLVDAVAPAGRCDLVRDVAYPLPAIVIAELLGVPPADRDVFKRWSDDVTRLVFGGGGGDDDRRRAQAGLVELADYLRGLLAEHRRRPADDLMSALLAAEERGDALSEDEIVSTCTLLLFGGHETTTNLIANGFLALMRHPDQLARLDGDPEPELVAAGVEELNRYDGPSKFVVRRAAEPLELRGRRIRPGDQVLLAQAAANRDPERFAQPDRVVLDRPENRHVGFGFGRHYCLGAPLARMEAQVALPALVRRLREPELEEEPRWLELLVSRGLRRLVLSFAAC